MSARLARLLGAVLIVALEGPRRVWWAPPVMIVVGLLVGLMTERAWEAWAALGLIVGGAWWWVARVAQYQYVKHLRREADSERCPRCGYSLAELDDDTCPECGTDRVRLRDAIDRVMEREEPSPPRPG